MRCALLVRQYLRCQRGQRLFHQPGYRCALIALLCGVPDSLVYALNVKFWNFDSTQSTWHCPGIQKTPTSPLPFVGLYRARALVKFGVFCIRRYYNELDAEAWPLVCYFYSCHVARGYMIMALATGKPILPLSIDYTGGTVWELRFTNPVAPADIRKIFVDAGYSDTISYNVADDKTVEIKLKTIDNDQKQDLLNKINTQFGASEELAYRSVGPSIGSEVSQSAFIAVVVASLLNPLLYLAFAFRQVEHPFRYGICAVIALVHDVLVTITFVCIMNWLAGWEIDALFLTAILTVVGYSVSDTVVVFDRIRENLRRTRGESLTMIANRSIIETAARSLGTAFTTLLTSLQFWSWVELHCSNSLPH